MEQRQREHIHAVMRLAGSGLRAELPRLDEQALALPTRLAVFDSVALNRALYLWLAIEPGLLRSLAFNVMAVAGFSTLVFNGNPLLRYDGYYILADAIEIPNLGARSNTYLGYLFQRYVLGIKTAESPAHSNGERAWMTVYGIASFIYRIFISFIIITFIAGKFFVIGFGHSTVYGRKPFFRGGG